MINLLTTRVKDAKSELTALKTAYVRGLGLMDVYTYNGTANPPSREDYFFKMVVTFDPEFAQNPLTYMSIGIGDLQAPWLGSALEIYNQTFTSDGFALTVNGLISWAADDIATYTIYSTSPITNVSWEWTLDE